MSTKPQTNPEVTPIIQQVGVLNLRINDMMAQLNAVMKMLVDENNALKKENADIKAAQKSK